MADVKIEASWKEVLSEQFDQPYFTALVQYLKKEKTTGKAIYPPGNQIFNAFAKTPFEEVKVVILGQDPYHNPGEAMGLSFSVPRGVRVPPSLQNIYKELKADLAIEPVAHGDLTPWTQQGVFLLNSMLTVEHKKAGSHRKIGWQHFTNAAIRQLSIQREGLAFLLWGNFARSKKELIDPDKHLILEAAHPSPLARGAYFGSAHFSKVNAYLSRQGKPPIEWALPK